MPHARHVGIFPGDNRIIDRAGWQCTAKDADQLRGRCVMIATHTHRRHDGDRIRAVALCGWHYELAGPEATTR
jgi:hypothetical protein